MQEANFVADLLLEGGGFELPVPPGLSAQLGVAPRSSSQRTPRWREQDLNRRSLRGLRASVAVMSAVHCCTRRDQPKAVRNHPLHVGALGAPDGLEALEGLALVFKPEE